MEQIIKDIIGFIRSFYEAVMTIIGSVEKDNNWTKPEYQA